MVQKYQSPVRVYKYPFELVMSAYERRFPTCKMIPVFLGSDIISEYKSEDGAIHVVERRCRLNVDAPYILKKIAGVDCVIFVQKNALDRRNRTLLIEARNETFSSRVIVNEFCQYTVHPENSGWTCFEQSASLDIKHFFGFESTVEKIAMKQYSTNIKKGKEVIEYYINELISEGVKNIPTWLEQQEVMKLALGIPVDEADIAGSSKETIEEEDQYEDAIMTLGASAAALRRSSIQEEEKLEDEYIHRCLGELTPFQESQLVQLKKWIADTHKGKMPQDEHMLRFLRARDFNVEKAREMLCHSLAWRKKYGIDRLLITYTPATLIQQYFPGGWHSAFDHEGRPMFLLRLGATDVKGVLKCVGTDGLLHHILWILEEGLRRCEEATQRFGRPISNCTCILDLDGLSMRHLWRPGIRALLDIIQTVEANYPETMGRLLIVRAPRVFPVLWTLVSPFIDENTRRKFTILAQSDLLTSGGLVDYIGRESVPRWLGGPCTDCGIYCEGGLVPKEAFQFEFAAESPDTVYKIAVVKEPSPYELMVVVDERSSVITWDFDILKGEVLFSVYRCRNPLSRPAVEGETLLDSRTMQEGIDYVMVVQSIACKDGDSIQGSHVCSQPGCYVLQWRFFDSTHSLLDFSHKARIMYFCELIRGENFRGSMTSLQSSISSTAGSSSAPNSAR